MIRQCLLCLLLPLLLLQCSKEDPSNPYDSLVYPSEGQDSIALETGDLIRLHRDIFLPTCANSGCHDGSFEPDFRTPQSTYNTTVGHVAIKGRPGEEMNIRVKPGDASNSMLLFRLEQDLENSSGIMPLSIDPGSDWPEQKGRYIEDIKAWINAGAKNIIDG